MQVQTRRGAFEKWQKTTTPWPDLDNPKSKEAETCPKETSIRCEVDPRSFPTRNRLKNGLKRYAGRTVGIAAPAAATTPTRPDPASHNATAATIAVATSVSRPALSCNRPDCPSEHGPSGSTSWSAARRVFLPSNPAIPLGGQVFEC